MLSSQPRSSRKRKIKITKKSESIKKNKKKIVSKQKIKPKKFLVNSKDFKIKKSVQKIAKKDFKKALPEKPQYKLKLIGEITHYFSKISVVVIKLSDGLKKGDRIQIKGATVEFIQEVKSMQIESVDVSTAKKGQLIGLKIVNQAKVGDKVYKVLT